jgi:hypothetical protein
MKPSVLFKEYSSMTNHNPSGFSVGGSISGNVNNVQGSNNSIVQGDNNQVVIGNDNRVSQQQESTEIFTKADIVSLLTELESLVNNAELSADIKAEVVEDLNAAKTATDREAPNKKRALERLTSVAETLEKTSKSIDAGHKIWQTAKPLLIKVAAWLGAGAGSYFFGL